MKKLEYILLPQALVKVKKKQTKRIRLAKDTEQWGLLHPAYDSEDGDGESQEQ